MSQGKSKSESYLQELVTMADRLNIEVRTEKLLREVGYHTHSGLCRLKGRDVIIIDRDTSVGDQVEFLAAELSKREPDLTGLSPYLREILKPKPS